jgi:thioesterase domain-containing protein/acyl carrier protein
VFLDELAAAYRGVVASEPIALAPMHLQYADVATWQHHRLTVERRQQGERFWRQQFAGAPVPLALHRARIAQPDHRLTAQIAPDTLDAVETLGAAEGTTSFVVSLAAYAAFLAAATGSNDIILCTPAVGRDHEELQGIIGYINNVLPLRIAVDNTSSFRTLIKRVRQRTLQALEWQDLPFQDITALPETQRIPLTRGMFSFSGRAIRSLRLSDCAIESIPVPGRSADFDLGLSIDSGEATLAARDGVLGAIEPSVFLEEYTGFLRAALASPDDVLRELHARVTISQLQAQGAPPAQRVQAPTAASESADMVVGLTKDPLELQLAEIWSRLFGIRPISPDDNFFALGGHSLLAVRLLDTIERELGRALTLAALVEHPTVRLLAKALTTAGWAPEPGSLIRMRAGGTGVPIILLHSFEGHLFLYNELADELARHHPVFGFQAVGLDGQAEPHRTVEAMAAHYLQLLDAQFGDRPLVLAAMCFGVSTGLEIARRRHAAGTPTHLMLIDSAWEQVVSFVQPGVQRTLATRLRDRATLELSRGRYALQESLRLLTASPYARREARIRRRTSQAWLSYPPSRFDGRVTLFRTHSATPSARDWKVESVGVVATGDFATVHVPGDHFTVLHAPFAASLADAMRAALDRPPQRR